MEDNKRRYASFCESAYVPIYSKPWWLDAVCKPENWDVWLYESGEDVLAAMPYYKEMRGSFRYITKAPLSQHNGLVFKYADMGKLPARLAFEEKVVNQAVEFIQSLGLDVYEQQYSTDFRNWQPFYWHDFTCLVRYSYIIDDTSDMEAVNRNITSKTRAIIRKGNRNSSICEDLDMMAFREAHQKVFFKQDLPYPYSLDLWTRLYNACVEHGSGKIICARDGQGNVNSVIFAVWDERKLYMLMGGSVPEFSSNETYAALIHHAMKMASEMGLAYDFEGSMVRRIARSFREFGAVPKPYYRIRKVFNPEIVRMEAEDYIRQIQKDNHIADIGPNSRPSI